MSVIGKKPFVNKIIDKCSKAYVSKIVSLMDNLGEAKEVALYGQTNLISIEDIGVNYVSLAMERLSAKIIKGILVYIDASNCGFFGIATNSDIIEEFSIDPVHLTFEKIREYLTVEELRQVCGDRLVEVGENITVQADDIDSGSTASGKALLADGEGGASWGTVRTFSAFNPNWPTTGTTAEFCAAVNSDTNATIGMGYMGGATFSDLPFEGNGDIVVEVLQGPSAGSKSIHLILTSGTNAPYHWEYTYWNNQSQNGWVSLGGGNGPKVWTDFEDIKDILSEVKVGDIIEFDEDPDFTAWYVFWVEKENDENSVVGLINFNSEGEQYYSTYYYDSETESWIFEDEVANVPISRPNSPNSVLVSNIYGKWGERKTVPLADNLQANPETNDTLYSSGPTGGLADIATGEESYLAEVKGLTIIWNQLLDSEHTSYTTKLNNIYLAYFSTLGSWELVQNVSTAYSYPSYTVLFDLTLMFGGNDKIPFSLSDETEYPANGTIPAQTVTAAQRFQRLFANVVDLRNAPYDAGTPKNVEVTKLVETGQNLWDASTMESTGLQLLAGYRYEIYLNGESRNISISSNGVNFGTVGMDHSQRADGKYIYSYKPSSNVIIKSVSGYPITFVGFVHSGNYCLTTGTINSSNANTDATIPAYTKHEFNIWGIDGLNGLLDTNGKVSVYDTKDYTRVGVLDLSQYQSVMTFNSDYQVWSIAFTDLPSNMDTVSIGFGDGIGISQNGYDIQINADDEASILIFGFSSPDPDAKPTGLFYYKLLTPVATGAGAFEPIPLKSGNDWIVNDMGSEYFIQPSDTNCPVNQMSTYYENLKDKLVNLQMPEIEPASYDYSLEPINAIYINGNKYRMLPLGTSGVSNNDCIAIGSGSGTSSFSDGVAIGTNAKSRGGICIGKTAQEESSGAVVIGNNATSRSNSGVAIGAKTKNWIDKSVSFDSNDSSYQRSLHMYSPEKIFFRNDYSINNTNYNTFDKYLSGHYLSEYIQNNALTQESGTNKFYLTYTDSDNFTTFTQNKVSGTATAIDKKINGVHIVIKLSGTTSHSVVGLDLLPYDSANSYGFSSYGRVEVDGVVNDITATIDSDGVVNITAPTGGTIDSVVYNLR